MSNASEAGGERDFGDVQFGVVEKSAREVCPSGSGELFRGDAEVLNKEPSQVTVGDAELVGQFAVGCVVEHSGRDEGDGLTDDFGAGPGDVAFGAVRTAT